MKIKILLAIILTTLAGGSQAATVYACYTQNGVVYTSQPQKGCQTANLPPIGKYSSAAPRMASSAPVQKKAQPTESTRKKNNPTSAHTRAQAKKKTVAVAATAAPKPQTASGRVAILQQELANEKQALAQARQALTRIQTSSPNNKEEMDRLNVGIADRKANIQALQRELSRM